MNTIFGSINKSDALNFFQSMISFSRNKIERHEVVYSSKSFVFGGLFDLRFGLLDNFLFEDENIIVLVDGVISNIDIVKQEINFNGGAAEAIAKFIDIKGIKNASIFFDGAFSIVLFNKINEEIILIKDKSGIKPLYFGTDTNSECIFSSDYRHVLNTKYRDGNDIDISSLQNYFLLGYTPEGDGIVKDTFSIPHGSYMIFQRGKYSFNKYYSMLNIPYECVEDELSDVLGRKVRDIVSLHDSGVLLSGGVDSPLVASFACEKDEDILCLTTTSTDKDYSEKETSSKYAEIFGLNHKFVDLTDDEVLEAINDNKEALTEPLCDFSTIPTLILAKHAQKLGLKILLTGDAADELFCGYSRDWDVYKNRRYLLMNKFALGMSILKGRLGIGERVPLRLIYTTKERYLYEKMYIPGMRGYIGHLIKSNNISKKPLFYRLSKDGYRKHGLMNMMRSIEFDYHLQRCLIKTDRSLRYYGLEVKSPFLTNTIMNYAMCQDPHTFFDNDGKGKHNLKLLLAKRSNSDIPFLKKKGFSIPLDVWINGFLREEIDGQLSNIPYILNSVIDRKVVDKILFDHRNGICDNRWVIWSLYSLFTWCNKCINIL